MSMITKAMHEQEIYDAIAVLNRALEADRSCITQLLKTRVGCNTTLADDPTIQVLRTSMGDTLGPLGLINGLFGIRRDGYGYIASVYEVVCPDCGPKEGLVDDKCDCGKALIAGKLIKFMRTPNV